MINVRQGVFHLRNEEASYLFRVKDGFLEHLHFGARAETADALAFAARPGCGWGDSTLYREGSNADCLDILPLEWSGCGRGDYRESPLELSIGGRAVSTDFRYLGCEVLKEPPPSALPVSRGQTILAVYLEDAAARLRLTLLYGVLPTVFTRRAILEKLRQLRRPHPQMHERLHGASRRLGTAYLLRRLDRRDAAHPHARHHGKDLPREYDRRLLQPRQPRLPARRAGRGRAGGRGLRLQPALLRQPLSQRAEEPAGPHPRAAGHLAREFRLGTRARRAFETPEAVMAYSGAGFGGLSACFHRYVNEHLIPPDWQGRPRPIVYNSWEGCMFDFTESKLLRLGRAAKQLGCEMFVLDDGWFGKRNSDTSSLGDYTVNEKKLPGGLRGLGEKLNAMGLQFGLWFEPESVSPDSELYRQHPDWALHDILGREDLLGRHQLLLDLTKPEVRDYLVESVGGILDSAPICYVKWDMNRHSCALGAQQHAFVLGLYDVLRRIFLPRPQILLESCSSGGNRFDCGMLWFSPQIWCSDDTDPVERLRIQQSLSFLYPPSCFGTHVSASPHAQTLRHTPLSTRGNVSLFGCLGYELDLTELLPVEQAEIRAQTEFYRAHRRTLQYGRFTRGRTDGGGTVWQMQTKQETVAAVFHGLQPAAPGYEHLCVTGLDGEKQYRLTSRPPASARGRFRDAPAPCAAREAQSQRPCRPDCGQPVPDVRRQPEPDGLRRGLRRRDLPGAALCRHGLRPRRPDAGRFRFQCLFHSGGVQS